MPEPVLDQFSALNRNTSELPVVSDDDKKIVNQVNTEVKDMDESAQFPRQEAKAAINGYMALTRPPGVNGRSKLFIPKIHSIVYSRIAMEAASMPTVEYKARNEDSEMKMQFINAAKDNAETGDGNLRPDAINLWFHQNFDKILFGVGFRYLTYHLQKRTIRVKDDK